MSAETVSESMLGKIRALLAKAEDPACTPAEAEAFNDKAAQLLAKYGVDRAMLAASDPTADVVGDRRVEIFNPYQREKGSLLVGIATALRCRAVNLRNKRTRTVELHLFGFASDLERVEMIYTSLLVQAGYGLAGAQPPDGENVAAFRRSWLLGFALAVKGRLTRAETQAAGEHDAARMSGAPGTAVVLATRKDQVDKATTSVYPRLTSGAPRTLRGSGMNAGYASGQRADLGGARVGRSAHSGRAISS